MGGGVLNHEAIWIGRGTSWTAPAPDALGGVIVMCVFGGCIRVCWERCGPGALPVCA